MSRPIKDGIDYFSFDTDFFADDKIRLLRGEFGAKGILIYLYVLCDIYRGNGYYSTWDEDRCLLVSLGAACGVTPEFTSQVIKGCVRRSLFNDKLFNVSGVLTSAGIQRRYVKACSARDEIRIKREYWLLNENDKKDVPAGALNKITFVDENLQNNGVNSRKNEVNLQKNPESKVKESKGKKRESLQRGAGAAQTQQKGKSAAKSQRADDGCLPVPSLDEVKEFYRIEGLRGNPERFFHLYDARDWRDDQGNRVRNWKALARYWSAGEREQKPTPATVQPKSEPTYDLDSWEQLMQDYVPVKE